MEERNEGVELQVLVVTGDELYGQRMAEAFRVRNHSARHVADHLSAMAVARDFRPELIVVDLDPSDGKAFELVHGLRTLGSWTRIVILSEQRCIAPAFEAVRLGATYFLARPIELENLLTALLQPQPQPISPERTSRPLEEVEYDYIQYVLACCDGNVSRAARALGLHRRSLQRKLTRQRQK